MIATVRKNTEALWNRGTDNISLLFDRGLIERALAGQPASEGGTREARLIECIAGLPVPDVYCRAYERWSEVTAATDYFARWIGRLDGRLILGAGSPHVLEAALTFSRPYGVPTIPGSSLKGIAHALAREEIVAGRMQKDVVDVLFGRTPSTNGNDMGDGGYLIFHDAWWVPDSARTRTPCAAEVVTVHHPEYYRSYGGTPATDFDGPTPCPQLAARGSFLFAIEGVQSWANLGLKCLRTALEQCGVGGKAAAGYGYFVNDEKANAKLAAAGAKARLATLPPDKRLREIVRGWTDKQIAEHFGKGINKTRTEYSAQFEQLLEIVRDERAKLISQWAQADKDTAEGKAFRKLRRE